MKSIVILFSLLGLFLCEKTYTPNIIGQYACQNITVDAEHKKKCTIANMNLGDDYRCCYVEGETNCYYFPDDGDKLKEEAKSRNKKIDCSSSMLTYSFLSMILLMFCL